MNKLGNNRYIYILLKVLKDIRKTIKIKNITYIIRYNARVLKHNRKETVC